MSVRLESFSPSRQTQYLLSKKHLLETEVVRETFTLIVLYTVSKIPHLRPSNPPVAFPEGVMNDW